MLLVVFAMLAILVFAYPLYVMMPFRAQGASELAFSLWLRKWAPGIATASAAGAVTVAVLRWRVSRGWGQRIATAFCAATAVTFAAHAITEDGDRGYYVLVVRQPDRSQLALTYADFPF